MPPDNEIANAEPLFPRITRSPMVSLLRPALGLLVINLCAFAVFLPRQVIGMPSEIDFGFTESGITKSQTIEIENRSSSPIICLGATEACGYGCHKASALPKTISPGKSIRVSIEYKTPFPDALARRGVESGSVIDEMIFYFDDSGVSQRILRIRCQIKMP